MATMTQSIKGCVHNTNHSDELCHGCPKSERFFNSKRPRPLIRVRHTAAVTPRLALYHSIFCWTKATCLPGPSSLIFLVTMGQGSAVYQCPPLPPLHGPTMSASNFPLLMIRPQYAVTVLAWLHHTNMITPCVGPLLFLSPGGRSS